MLRTSPETWWELQQYLKPSPAGTARERNARGWHRSSDLDLLGSSLFGAQLAAALGMPFAFASHFAPTYLSAAIDTYREQFKPSETLKEPYVMLGFNLCAAESDAHAHFLRSSSLQAFVNLRRGVPGPLPEPIEDFEVSLSTAERQMVDAIGQCSAVGNLETVQAQIGTFLAQTGADELMLVSSIFDPEQRLKSYELGSIAMQNLAEATAPRWAVC